MRHSPIAVLLLLAFAGCSDGPSTPVAPSGSAVAQSQGQASLLSDAPVLAVAGSGQCSSMKATLSGRCSEAGCWVGDGAMQVGKGAPESFTFLDEGVDGGGQRSRAPNAWSAAEKITLSFQGGDQLVMNVLYLAVPDPAPGLFQYNASGDLGGGTGRFGDASGHVSVQGIFTVEPAATWEMGFQWIARISGQLCR